jgi:rubrerythrin
MKQTKEDCTDYDDVCASFTAEFEVALQANDVGTLLKLKYFVEDLHTLERPRLQERLISTGLLANAEETIQKLRAVWVQTFQAGGFLDIYSEREMRWFDSKILEVNSKEGNIMVHYMGWDAKYDEFLDVSAKRLCPQYSFTKSKKKTVKVSSASHGTVYAPATALVEPVAQREPPAAEVQLTETALTERSRRRRSRTDGVTEVENSTNSANKRRNTTTDSAATTSGAVAGVVEEAVGKEEKEEKDRNDWVCTICGWFEAPDGSDLVCCDGKTILVHVFFLPLLIWYVA